MATVTIPFGGQSVTVDVSDLASEATLRDLYTESAKQSALLSSIAQRLGTDVQKEIQTENKNTDKLIRAIQDEGRKSDSRLGSMLGKMRGAFGGVATAGGRVVSSTGGVFNKLTSSAGDEKGSTMAEEMLGSLGLGAMGAQLGTLFGIFEEFGNSMSNLRRVGTGYAEDLEEFKTKSSEIGLSLEQFGEITGQTGIAIRALGDNTTDGAKNFLSLTSQLRNGIKEFGYFGLNSKEMARLLADEAEIRRGMLQTDMSSATAQADMVASIKNQLLLNEQMASLTGQDIQDRIKASQNFRQDATNAAMLARLNEKQRVAANSAIEGLTQLGGSAGPMLDTAMSNLLAGLPMDSMNEGFSEFAAFAQAEGIDLRGALQQMQQMILAGADPETLKGTADQLANQFKELTPSDSVIRASRAGIKGATDLLQARLESVSSGSDTLSGSVEKLNETALKMTEAAEAGQLALSGTAAEMGKFAATLRTTLMEEITEAFDMDITSNEFPKFVRALADLPSSDGFRDAVSFMTETTTMLSGAQGLLGLLKENQSAAQGENVAFMASILGALGLPGAAQLRLLALGLEGDELGPELQEVIKNMFGENEITGYDENGDPIQTNPLAGMFDGFLETWANMSTDIKNSIDNGASINQALATAIARLNTILPELKPNSN